MNTVCGGCVDGICTGNCHKVMRNGKVRKHSGKEYDRMPEEAFFMFDMLEDEGE